MHVGQRFLVRLLAGGMGVGHEHHAVHALEHGLAREAVVDLARDRVEVEAGGEPVHVAEIEGQEVEEQGALVVGGDGEQPAPSVGRQPVVELSQVGGLAAQAGAAIDDLEVDLASPMVDERHGIALSSRGRRRYSPKRASSSWPAASANASPDTSAGNPGSEIPTFSNSPRNTRSQPERAAAIEHRAHDDAVREQAGVHGALLPFADHRFHARLPEQQGELRVGGEVRGHQAGERGGVEIAGASGRGDQLAGAVHEVHGERVGSLEQLRQHLVDGSKIVFEQSPLWHASLAIGRRA